MDVVLNLADKYLLDNIWAKILPSPATASNHFEAHPFPTLLSNTSSASSQWSDAASAWPRDYLPRQIISLTFVTLIGTHAIYFIFAGLSYYFVFNHAMMRHPRFLPNQVRQEIMCSLAAFPGLTALTLPWFIGEVRGWSRLYDRVDDYGWTYLILSIPAFLLFTDYCIYWIHRWLHLPFFYKHLHKPHHKWIIPTPFAAYAFHPIDAFAQSIPYHVAAYLVPIQRHLYLGMFAFINLWSILIHDSDMITGHPLENVINGPAHHTLHHLYFVCNYGQYFTWADKAGGSYRHPLKELDPMLEIPAEQRDANTKKVQ